ncbi:Hypothetical predicted protein [Paramuricea clavata]|uniref:Uncharacterized protein n=1 Tax=Paramuricea clavata TaxID=317549 RepID=A0A7D9DUR2_PARCT|nr:Hypothetical predicted protein [Paramuricea clavata]
MWIIAILAFAVLVTQSSASVPLEFIFYANATHVMYVPSSGGGSTVIRSATNTKLGYDATTRRLYVFEEISSKLFSMKLDGSDSQEMFGIGGGIKRFSVDDINEKIYYISEATDFTNSRNFGGSSFTLLLGDGNDDLTDIQVDSMMK